ncbi:MAG: hypothetical protein ABI705_02565 [Aestuariivirga sp.]
MKNTLITLLRILLGYFASCYVAGFAVGRLTLALRSDLLGGFFEDNHTAGLPFTEAMLIALGIAVFMFLPALLAIIPAEVFGIRRVAYYVVLATIFAILLSAYALNDFGTITVVFAVAGAMAGLTYWYIAGRRAGLWETETHYRPYF